MFKNIKIWLVQLIAITSGCMKDSDTFKNQERMNRQQMRISYKILNNMRINSKTDNVSSTLDK